MRVTQKMVMDDLVKSLSNINSRIASLEEKASSGKRINKPSDDPAAYYKTLDINSAKNSITQFETNLSSGKNWLSSTDSALGSVYDLLVRAKEITLANSNDTVSANERKNAAQEVSGIFEQVVQTGNTQVGSSFIFGGTEILSEPFDSNGEYNGNQANIEIEIDKNKRMVINCNGKDVFKKDGGEDIFNILNDLKTGLENNDKVTIQAQIDKLDSAMDQISDYRANVGAKINHIDNTSVWFQDSKSRLDVLLSDNQDADMTEVITDLAREQTALQATLSSAAKVISYSLVDFLK